MSSCGRHSASELEWLAAEDAAALARYGGLPWVYGCINCGRRRLGEWQDHELECSCGWPMVSVAPPSETFGPTGAVTCGPDLIPTAKVGIDLSRSKLFQSEAGRVATRPASKSSKTQRGRRSDHGPP